jgi:uncharacterized membrane protein YqhA
VCELLISNIEATRQTRGEGNGTGLINIESLDALKETLVKVIVVALIVAGLGVMLVFPITTPGNLLVFSASVLLLASSAYLVAGNPNSKH